MYIAPGDQHIIHGITPKNPQIRTLTNEACEEYVAPLVLPDHPGAMLAWNSQIQNNYTHKYKKQIQKDRKRMIKAISCQ